MGMQNNTFATVIATARRTSGLSAAEFDYQLTLGTEFGRAAYNALGNAIYRIANEGVPEVTVGGTAIFSERRARDAALREQLADDIDRCIAEAKAKAYTGWSNASRGPIRYAR